MSISSGSMLYQNIMAFLTRIGGEPANEIENVRRQFFRKSKLNNKSYNFHFLFKFNLSMASRIYSIDELKSLLKDTSEEILHVLLNPSAHNNQYFYQNFTSISLKAIKYINHFLNHLNTNQAFGSIIDELLKSLTESLQQYKGRNIFTHANYSQEAGHHCEEDQIYHFLNTRNNLLPAQCLNSYENERQRLELQEFVQKMEKQAKLNPKESKRSLMLPKENNSKIKFGRKATFDVELKPIQEEIAQTRLVENVNKASPKCENVEIQTFEEELLQIPAKKTEVDIASQCDTHLVSETAISTLSNSKIKTNQNVKKTGGNRKKNGQGDSKNKKAKFNPHTPPVKSSSTNRSQDEFCNLQEKTMPDLSKDKEECSHPVSLLYSLKSMKMNEPILAICNKQVNVYVSNQEIVASLTNRHSNPKLANSRKRIGTETFAKSFKSITKINYQLTQKDDDGCQEMNKQIDLRKSASFVNDTQIEKCNNFNQRQVENKIQTVKTVTNEEAQFKEALHFDIPTVIQAPKIDAPVVKTSELHKFQETNKQEAVYNHIELKIPVSSVKIVENSEFLNQEKYPKQQHSNISHYIGKEGMKRKTFISSKLNFKSLNPNEAENEVSDIPKNLVTSKINLEVYPEKIKCSIMQNQQQDEKLGTYAVNNVIESYSSSPSQDYLKSRQKSDPLQLVNRLIQLRKNEQSDESSENSTPLMSFKSGAMLKSKMKSQQTIREKQPSQSQSSSGNLMMVFSNRNQPILNQPSRFKMDHKSIIQKSKDKKIVGDQSCEGANQSRTQSVSVKQGHLSTITQATKPQEGVQAQLSQAVSRKLRSNNSSISDHNKLSSSPSKLLPRQQSTLTPIKTSFSKLNNKLLHLSSSKSATMKKFSNSASEHHHSQNHQRSELRRKLRNRAYKDKLSQYLDLIEITHQKFCGSNCEHLAELFKGKEGSVSQQIVRLYNRLK